MPVVLAQEGHINLLALVEQDSNRSGAVVDLFLEVKEGNDRVFLETVPLTKITTQISMRFAKQIACKELEHPCSRFDYFYTIRGFPGVVGGPSAGAAATVLTMSVLQNVDIDPSIAITGTINSGGVIGPVGGVKEKIEAAAAADMKTVLIPRGTAAYADDDNVSIDLIAMGKSLGVDVIEVEQIEDALPYFGHFDLPKVNDTFDVGAEFDDKLRSVAKELCDRRDDLLSVASNASHTVVENLTQQSIQSYADGNYYAAASYCFRSNVQLRQDAYRARNMSDQAVLVERDDLRRQVDEFAESVEARELNTITDLQVFMSVDERLVETYSLLDDVESSEDAELLGYALERFESSKSWSSFFEDSDKMYVVDDARLRQGCIDKLSEAEERYSYVIEFLPSALGRIRGDLNEAYEYLNSEQYVRCLYSGSKVKAEIDSLLGLIGVDDLAELTEVKLSATRRSLVRSQSRGVFPIISYNYAQYAESLKEYDEQSALLFVEYALEFSSLDIYFDEPQPVREDLSSMWDIGGTEGFLIGIGVGIIFTMIYLSFAVGYVRKKTLQTPKRSRGKKR